jgi:transglutaminase-like putative cysteine protease
MTERIHWLAGSLATAILLLGPSISRAADSPLQRTFLFTYAGAVIGLPSGQPVHLWLPMPPSTDAQSVELVRQSFPATPLISQPTRIGNRFIYLDAPAGKDGTVPFSITYRITRRALGQTLVTKSENADAYLKPDSLVPVGGKPAEVMLTGKTVPAQPLSAARFLYDLVDDTMQYRKDKPGWGRGDAAWACESHFGNCTDFHSLFISLARTERIPARFDIGFAIPVKRGHGNVPGYHCWAQFMADGNWVPVDISEANQNPDQREYDFGHLDASRVMFTTGRDLTLDPPQAGPPLNFFVYPYAEVNGKPYPADKITHAFAYEDVK